MKIPLLFVVLVLTICTTSKIKTKFLQNPDTGTSIAPCGDDRLHIMCHRRKAPMRHCTGFHLLPITPDIIIRIMHGINGLRSREAKVFGHEIANMNLLHWDNDLGEMAKQYVLRCYVAGVADSTNYIGDKNHTVGQNYFYMQKILDSPQWFQVPIHFWFLSSLVNKPSQYSSDSQFTPYTQVIWPLSEFVGCAGANVFQGTLFVCYFGPRADENNHTVGFRQGPHCSECPGSKPTCSTNFGNLCGNDLAVTGTRPNPYIILVTLLIGLIGCESEYFI